MSLPQDYRIKVAQFQCKKPHLPTMRIFLWHYCHSSITNPIRLFTMIELLHNLLGNHEYVSIFYIIILLWIIAGCQDSLAKNWGERVPFHILNIMTSSDKSGELGQYYGCWHSRSLHYQDLPRHSIDNTELTSYHCVSSLRKDWERISTTYKYFMLTA